MAKRVIILLLIAAMVMAGLPAHLAKADSGQVLLVYNNKEEMAVISDLIQACGMVPVPVSSFEYTENMVQGYDYIVLQDDAPLKDVLRLGKKVVCLGHSFQVLPGIQIGAVDRIVHAELSVYENSQSILLEQGTSYIESHSGEAVGIIRLQGSSYPIGVIGDTILYAPYLRKDDLSAFAAAEILNRYFGRQDDGQMFVMIDEIYPFEDIGMLKLTAERLYENGIPFIMGLMPVYYNTDYPSFEKYADALRYIQSKSGTFVMHDPIITGNELVGEPLDVRMKKAYETFEQNGIHIFDKTAFPYDTSLDMLSGIHPQNQLYDIRLPIHTVIRFGMFQDEKELDAAIDAIHKKRIHIGDYRRFFTDDEYAYKEAQIDDQYVYREVGEQKYELFMNQGNRVLIVLVMISIITIAGLMLLGRRLYRNKFLRRRK